MALAQMNGTPSSEPERGASAALGVSGASSALPGFPTTVTHASGSCGGGAKGNSTRNDSIGPGVALKGGATSANDGLRRRSAMAGVNDVVAACGSGEERHVSFSDSTKRNSGGRGMHPDAPAELLPPGGRPGGVTHPEGDSGSDGESGCHGGARSLLRRSPAVARRGSPENRGVQKLGGSRERRGEARSKGEGELAERGGGGALSALWRLVVGPHRPHTLQRSNAVLCR